MASKWKIKEVNFNSLAELNKYIEEKDIAPSNVLRYNTIFDQLKQQINYILTYWTIKE